MKIKLYFENEKAIAKSGIGKALRHQQSALKLNGIEYTHDHREKEYDILHINTVVYQGWLVDHENCYKASSNREFIYLINDMIHSDLTHLTTQGYQLAKTKSLMNIGKSLKKAYEMVLKD